MDEERAKYNVGQVIHHRLFDYRGVIVDVDSNFQHTDEWYSLMARNNPPKDEPWYHILVHDSDYMTYVAEQNLEIDADREPINHPEVEKYFGDMVGGIYTSKRQTN